MHVGVVLLLFLKHGVFEKYTHIAGAIWPGWCTWGNACTCTHIYHCRVCDIWWCMPLKEACNPVRCNKTPTAEKLASLSTVVDRFHLEGQCGPLVPGELQPIQVWVIEKSKCVTHTTFTDSIIGCKLKLYIPHEGNIFLIQVDTESCEQLFSCLSWYAQITQHMKRECFLFHFTSVMNLTVTCSAIHLHHCITVCIPEFLFL